MTTTLNRWPVLVVGAAIGILVAAANFVGGGNPAQAILAAAFPIAYALVVTILARNNELASVLAGSPVDERFAQLNTQAGSLAFGATAIVALGAFLVAQATNGDWLPWALLCALMALTYLLRC